jgi:hypothetical protein
MLLLCCATTIAWLTGNYVVLGFDAIGGIGVAFHRGSLILNWGPPRWISGASPGRQGIAVGSTAPYLLPGGTMMFVYQPMKSISWPIVRGGRWIITSTHSEEGYVRSSSVREWQQAGLVYQTEWAQWSDMTTNIYCRDVAIAWWRVLPAVALMWVAFGVTHRRRTLHARRLRAGLCARCGYDLRVSKQRCPECGSPIVTTIRNDGDSVQPRP